MNVYILKLLQRLLPEGYLVIKKDDLLKQRVYDNVKLEMERESLKPFLDQYVPKLTELGNLSEDTRKDIELNAWSFHNKATTGLLFKHITSWYVNESLFSEGIPVNNEFFRGTLNGIHMVRNLIEDYSNNYANRTK
jgi:hypothetical protein